MACLTLINALISSPDDLDFRIHLRNEFMRDGLIDVLEALENDRGEDLQTQLKIFQEHKEEDFDEFAQRYIFRLTMKILNTKKQSFSTHI